MRIISTTDISRPVWDSHIYETISLVTQFGVWAVISCLKILIHRQGATEREEIRVLCSTSSRLEAEKVYKSFGGVLNVD